MSYECGLEKVFGAFTAEVPDGPPGHPSLVFHVGMLPESPSRLETGRIVIRKVTHDYDGYYRADALWMYLTPGKCRELGVFLLSCLFHGPKQTTTLELTHPESQIKRLCVREDDRNLDSTTIGAGLRMIPHSLLYFPAWTRKHPWLDSGLPPYELPVFALSNADDCVGPQEADWASRDTVWLQGRQEALAAFAELLLNAGCSWNEVDEYQMEGDAGYRGVGPMSAELRIFLPNSFGWGFGENL